MERANRSEVVERFWGRINEAIGIIPRRVPHLLDLLELSATAVVGIEGTDWVESINATIRDDGQRLFDHAVARGEKRTVLDFFGIHSRDLKTFKLNDVEAGAVRLISKTVRERGIPYLLGTRAPEPLATDESLDITTPELRTQIINRIQKYYQDKGDVNCTAEVLSRLPVRVFEDSDTRSAAYVKCLQCAKELKITRDKPNRWTISNYNQHVNIHAGRPRTRRAHVRASIIAGRTRLRRRIRLESSEDSEERTNVPTREGTGGEVQLDPTNDRHSDEVVPRTAGSDARWRGRAQPTDHSSATREGTGGEVQLDPTNVRHSGEVVPRTVGSDGRWRGRAQPTDQSSEGGADDISVDGSLFSGEGTSRVRLHPNHLVIRDLTCSAANEPSTSKSGN